MTYSLNRIVLPCTTQNNCSTADVCLNVRPAFACTSHSVLFCLILRSGTHCTGQIIRHCHLPVSRIPSNLLLCAVHVLFVAVLLFLFFNDPRIEKLLSKQTRLTCPSYLPPKRIHPPQPHTIYKYCYTVRSIAATWRLWA